VSVIAQSPSAPESIDDLHHAYLATRDPDLHRALLDVHLGLAYRLAARFAHRGESMEDLRQVALLGLVKAINGFDPDRGLRFSTYALPTIIGELKRHFRDRGWAVRPPRRVHDLFLNTQRAIDERSQELGRSPTVAEIAEWVDASKEDVLEALEAGGLRRSASLDARVSPDDPRSLANTVGANDQRLFDVERDLTLNALLARLPEFEREIMRLRFVEGMTQREIARRVGRSQMQVSRLLARSLSRLRARAG
jgi:RNA polymerase sigma-B factor